MWIGEGPAKSSLLGLFLENGPLRIAKNGDTLNDFLVGLAPEGSWLDVVDLLYLD